MTYLAPPNPHPRLLELCPDGHTRKLDVLAFLNNGFVIDDEHWLRGRPDLITVKALPEAFTQPVIQPHGTIMHTQAGQRKASNLDAWGYAARPNVLNDAHVYGPQMNDGKIIHAIPFNHRADSNYLGNAFYVKVNGNWVLCGYASYETQDNGDATLAVTPWDMAQLGTTVNCLTAYHFVYQLACVEPATPTSRGIAHHSLFPTAWSKAGHDCPRAARIHQMPWIRQQVAQRLGEIYSHCGESCPGV